MFGVIRTIGKGIGKFVNEKLQVYTKVMMDPEKRLILGLILIGLGCGLVASVYIRVPIN